MINCALRAVLILRVSSLLGGIVVPIHPQALPIERTIRTPSERSSRTSKMPGTSDDVNSSHNGSSHRTEHSDEESAAIRVPRRTPIACQFCRGRKLKCDGRQTCANCQRRGLLCSYVPVSAQK